MTAIIAIDDNRLARLLAAGLLLASLLLCAGQARAMTFGFEAVEGAFPVQDILLDAGNLGSAFSLTLRNTGGDESGVITSIYFDWGSLDGLIGDPIYIDDFQAGVDYTDDNGGWFAATPGNMPGANTLDDPFQADFGLGPQKQGGVPNNGIGGGEYLGVAWMLGTLDYAGLVAALESGDVRVGVHLQSLPDGSSATGVSSPVPVPGAIWLFGSALVGLVGLRSRRG